jgi:hypothetical protein
VLPRIIFFHSPNSSTQQIRGANSEPERIQPIAIRYRPINPWKRKCLQTRPCLQLQQFSGNFGRCTYQAILTLNNYQGKMTLGRECVLLRKPLFFFKFSDAHSGLVDMQADFNETTINESRINESRTSTIFLPPQGFDE